MAGKLTPAAQVKLAEIATISERLHRVHGLVEQFAADRANGEQYLLPISRAFGQLKMLFTGSGFDAMAQLAGSMEMASRRGLSQAARIRVLRDGVGSLRFQLDLEQRMLQTEGRVEKKTDEGDTDAPDGTAG
jgi:hypothetical protein